MEKLARRTYVVDRNFQLKYSAMLMTVGALISALFGTMMYLAHAESERGLERAFATSGGVPAELRAQFADANLTLIALIVGATVLMAVALGLFGVLITHRVAGPISVMTRYVSALAEGQLPRLRPLRKNDELKGFFDQLTHAIEALRTREAEEAKALDEAIAQLTPIAGSDKLASLVELRARKREVAN